MKRKLFCEINPLCYKLSERKEIIRRYIKNVTSKDNFAQSKSTENLPYIWKGHTSPILRKLDGVDMTMQYNKITNLAIAGGKIDGLIITPGKTFSFWHTVGACTKRRGYITGLVIKNGCLSSDTGGGICQLANMIHYLVLHSPLKVTEQHHHSDALFPDSGRRVPFGTGTSVGYNMFDYCFKNTTATSVQLRIWQDGETLYGELRSDVPPKYRYKLVEEGHHYSCENTSDSNSIYYRNSEIYRIIIDRETGETLRRELLLRNHSRVMYDYSLIPQDEIK